ncbi:MAG: beta-galactosidase [Abditibacteriota bacterium]|nr:beta-galactosidase [Abditibacteriota bacterium]
MIRLLLFALLLACPACLFAEPAALYSCGGGDNTLFLIQGDDGRYDESLLEGRPCVMNRSFADYLYFASDPNIRKSLTGELWIVIKGQSDVLGQMVLRYNSKTGPYKYSEAVRLLMGKPDTLVFHLPDAAFAGSQNGGADFRIETYRFRLTGIEVYTQKPDIPVPTPEERKAEIDKEIALLPQGRLPAENPMEFVVCGDDGFGRQGREARQRDPFFGTSFDGESCAILKRLGVSSVECYVTFEGLMPHKEGLWEWEPWDREHEVLKKHGLRYSPFLIMGPSYAMPDWYRESPAFRPGKCLEHGESNLVDHIWNPDTPKYAEMFLRECSRHYGSGFLESVLLGIQGDFGEAIHPVMGGLGGVDPGLYHGHKGFWCDVPEALEDYRAWVKKRYRYLPVLNKAWGKGYGTFADVDFPARGEAMERLAEGIKDAAPQAKREYLDFVTWYREAMNDYADMWMKTAAKYFPGVPVYLCTGGNGEPQHGSDFSLNAKLCAQYGGGIRLTNEGSVYIHNNLATRLLTSAARFYGARFGKEPFGNVTPEGAAARIYGSVTSGCSQHEDYFRNLTDHPDKYQSVARYAGLLRREPDLPMPAVLYYPNIACTLGEPPWWPDYENIRYIVNCDYVDENMLRDGALEGRRIMVMPSTILEPGDIRLIMTWVRRGGLLIVMDREPMKAVDGTDASEKALFPMGVDDFAAGEGRVVRTDDFDEIARIITEEMEKAGYAVYYSPKHDYFGADLWDRVLFYNPGSGPVEAVYKYNGVEKRLTLPPGSIVEEAKPEGP